MLIHYRFLYLSHIYTKEISKFFSVGGCLGDPFASLGQDWPGPASTAVDRPLRKISSEGTAVRFPLKEASFQTRLNLINSQ